MNEQLTSAKLKVLRENIAHLDWRTIIEAKDGTPPETIALMDEYFKPFAQLAGKLGADGKFNVQDDSPCLCCGARWCGFKWGLVHGEGFCASCGWPARLYHFINDADGKEVMVIRGICLQVHPDLVYLRSEEMAKS